MPDQSTQLLHAAALGVVAGMRSQLPLALLSLAAHHQESDVSDLPEFLTSPTATALLLFSAAGELVVDKLPFTPSRLMPGSLAVRATTGGLGGFMLSRGTSIEPLRGAAIGAAGALLGSYVGYYVRAGLVQRTGLPDAVFAVLEDVTAITIGSRAVGLAR